MRQVDGGMIRVSALVAGLGLAMGSASLGCLDMEPPDDGTVEQQLTMQPYGQPADDVVSPEGTEPDWRVSPELPPDTTPRAVLSKQDVLDFSVDGTHLYWTSMTDAATGEELPRVSGLNLLTGQRTSIPAVKADSYVASMASDASHIYWVDYGMGRVLRAAKSGGSAELIATGQPGPFGIAVDAEAVYWTNFAGGTVMRAGKSGGAPVVLASGQQNPTSIAVSVGYVVWTNVGTGTVSAIDTDGQTLRTLATGQSFSSALVADDYFVYWANADQNAIMRSAVTFGKAYLFVPHQPGAAGMAIDATHIYWTSHGDQTVSRSDKMVASPEVLAQSQARPTRIAVTDSHIYWNNAESHMVVRLRK